MGFFSNKDFYADPHGDPCHDWEQTEMEQGKRVANWEMFGDLIGGGDSLEGGRKRTDLEHSFDNGDWL